MTIPLRILLTIGCVLTGFLFPPMLLLAIGIGWSIYNDLANAPEKITGAPPQKPELMTRERMHDLCESLAETAFLDAMLDAFDLKPSGDALVGGGIRLRTQIEVLRYKLDFLVDERLVVEIDGSLWHSSPEAVERDRVRDLELQAEGYSTCRIPAKVVLYRPREAIAQVKTARAAIPKNTPLPETKQVAEVSSPSEPIGARNVLGVMVKAADDFQSRTAELDAYHQIDSCLSGRFYTMELIVENACEQTALGTRIGEPTGVGPDEEKARFRFRRNIMKMSELLWESLEKRRKFSGKLDELRKNVSNEGGRAYCENRIETVVDEHLKKIAKWHATVFPHQAAFGEGRDSRLAARKDIINQLRAICFDDADPVEFAHPYCPPIHSRDFNDWWIRNVAGGSPLG